MGKGLAFLDLKKWHPSNKYNRARKWEAEQRAKQQQKLAAQREVEAKQEMEMVRTRQLIAQSSKFRTKEQDLELQRAEVSFMYNVPPGLKRFVSTPRNEKKNP